MWINNMWKKKATNSYIIKMSKKNFIRIIKNGRYY